MFIKNKNVLITGAANRIGREIAIHLSEIGMNIALHYNNSEENALKTLALIKKNNVKSDIFKADLSNENSCINLLENINKSLGEKRCSITSKFTNISKLALYFLVKSDKKEGTNTSSF